MLIFLQSQGMINLDDVRNKMKETERQRLLSQHKYKIFQDKDGRWKTTILDPSKKTGIPSARERVIPCSSVKKSS